MQSSKKTSNITVSESALSEPGWHNISQDASVVVGNQSSGSKDAPRPSAHIVSHSKVIDTKTHIDSAQQNASQSSHMKPKVPHRPANAEAQLKRAAEVSASHMPSRSRGRPEFSVTTEEDVSDDSSDDDKHWRSVRAREKQKLAAQSEPAGRKQSSSIAREISTSLSLDHGTSFDVGQKLISKNDNSASQNPLDPKPLDGDESNGCEGMDRGEEKGDFDVPTTASSNVNGSKNVVGGIDASRPYQAREAPPELPRKVASTFGPVSASTLLLTPISSGNVTSEPTFSFTASLPNPDLTCKATSELPVNALDLPAPPKQSGTMSRVMGGEGVRWRRSLQHSVSMAKQRLTNQSRPLDPFTVSSPTQLQELDADSASLPSQLQGLDPAAVSPPTQLQELDADSASLPSQLQGLDPAAVSSSPTQLQELDADSASLPSQPQDLNHPNESLLSQKIIATSERDSDAGAKSVQEGDTVHLASLRDFWNSLGSRESVHHSILPTLLAAAAAEDVCAYQDLRAVLLQCREGYESDVAGALLDSLVLCSHGSKPFKIIAVHLQGGLIDDDSARSCSTHRLIVVVIQLTVATSEYLSLGAELQEAFDSYLCRRDIGTENNLSNFHLSDDLLFQVIGDRQDDEATLKAILSRLEACATKPQSLTVFDVNDLKQLHDRGVVAVVFKTHVIEAKKPSDLVLRKVFRTLEKCGVRLIGLRSAYVDANHLDCKSFLHPEIWKDSMKKDNENQVPRMLLVASYVSVSGKPAAGVVRDAMGPDDPALARRTDASSIRAHLAKSKAANIAYPFPYSPENLWKDFNFWFVFNRNAQISVEGAEYLLRSNLRVAPPLLLLPETTRVAIGISFEADSDKSSAKATGEDRLNDIGAAESLSRGLSVLQLQICAALSTLCFEGFSLLNMQTINREKFHSLFPEPARASATQSIGDASNHEDGNLNFNLLCFLETTAGSITRLDRELLFRSSIERSQKSIEGSWAVSVFWKNFDDVSIHGYSKDSLSREYDVLHTFDESTRVPEHEVLDIPSSNFQSHEDECLPDVVVVVSSVKIANYYVANKVPRPSFHELLGLLAQLPTSVQPTLTILGIRIVSSRDQRSFKGIVCVRGMQIIENMKPLIPCDRDDRASNAKTEERKIAIFSGRSAWQQIVRYFTPFTQGSAELWWKLSEMQLKAHIPEWAWGDNFEQSIVMRVARSMFPPASFMSFAVMFLSFEDIRRHRLFSLVGRKLFQGSLRSQGLSLLRVKTVVMSESVASYLCDENVFLFGNQIISKEEELELVAGIRQTIGKPFMTLLVRGVNVRKLVQDVVGPPQLTVASRAFPRSLQAMMFQRQEAPSSFVKARSDDVHNIAILCAVTHRSVRHITISAFGVAIGEILEEIPLLLSTSSAPSTGGDSIETFSVTEGANGAAAKVRKELQAESDLDLSVHKSVGSKNANRKLVAKEQELQGSHLINLSIHNDVMCIVLTSALLRVQGLSSILDVLDKEGIQVRECESERVTLSNSSVV